MSVCPDVERKGSPATTVVLARLSNCFALLSNQKLLAYIMVNDQAQHLRFETKICHHDFESDGSCVECSIIRATDKSYLDTTLPWLLRSKRRFRSPRVHIERVTRYAIQVGLTLV